MSQTTAAIINAVQTSSVQEVKSYFTGGGQTSITTSYERDSLLHVAVRHGATVETVKVVAKYVPIDARNVWGETALHLACSKPRPDAVDIARQLVRWGADVNALNKNGETPLHWACTQGTVDVVKFLVAHGADINRATTRELLTPLHVATLNRQTAVVSYLLSAGADASCKDVLQRNASMLANLNGFDDVAAILDGDDMPPGQSTPTERRKQAPRSRSQSADSRPKKRGNKRASHDDDDDVSVSDVPHRAATSPRKPAKSYISDQEEFTTKSKVSPQEDTPVSEAKAGKKKGERKSMEPVAVAPTPSSDDDNEEEDQPPPLPTRTVSQRSSKPLSPSSSTNSAPPPTQQPVKLRKKQSKNIDSWQSNDDDIEIDDEATSSRKSDPLKRGASVKGAEKDVIDDNLDYNNTDSDQENVAAPVAKAEKGKRKSGGNEASGSKVKDKPPTGGSVKKSQRENSQATPIETEPAEDAVQSDNKKAKRKSSEAAAKPEATVEPEILRKNKANSKVNVSPERKTEPAAPKQPVAAQSEQRPPSGAASKAKRRSLQHLSYSDIEEASQDIASVQPTTAFSPRTSGESLSPDVTDGKKAPKIKAKSLRKVAHSDVDEPTERSPRKVSSMKRVPSSDVDEAPSRLSADDRIRKPKRKSLTKMSQSDVDEPVVPSVRTRISATTKVEVVRKASTAETVQMILDPKPNRMNNSFNREQQPLSSDLDVAIPGMVQVKRKSVKKVASSDIDEPSTQEVKVISPSPLVAPAAVAGKPPKRSSKELTQNNSNNIDDATVISPRSSKQLSPTAVDSVDASTAPKQKRKSMNLALNVAEPEPEPIQVVEKSKTKGLKKSAKSDIDEPISAEATTSKLGKKKSSKQASQSDVDDVFQSSEKRKKMKSLRKAAQSDVEETSTEKAKTKRRSLRQMSSSDVEDGGKKNKRKSVEANTVTSPTSPEVVSSKSKPPLNDLDKTSPLKETKAKKTEAAPVEEVVNSSSAKSKGKKKSAQQHVESVLPVYTEELKMPVEEEEEIAAAKKVKRTPSSSSEKKKSKKKRPKSIEDDSDVLTDAAEQQSPLRRDVPDFVLSFGAETSDGDFLSSNDEDSPRQSSVLPSSDTEDEHTLPVLQYSSDDDPSQHYQNIMPPVKVQVPKVIEREESPPPPIPQRSAFTHVSPRRIDNQPPPSAVAVAPKALAPKAVVDEDEDEDDHSSSSSPASPPLPSPPPPAPAVEDTLPSSSPPSHSPPPSSPSPPPRPPPVASRTRVSSSESTSSKDASFSPSHVKAPASPLSADLPPPIPPPARSSASKTPPGVSATTPLKISTANSMASSPPSSAAASHVSPLLKISTASNVSSTPTKTSTALQSPPPQVPPKAPLVSTATSSLPSPPAADTTSPPPPLPPRSAALPKLQPPTRQTPTVAVSTQSSSNSVPSTAVARSAFLSQPISLPTVNSSTARLSTAAQQPPLIATTTAAVSMTTTTSATLKPSSVVVSSPKALPAVTTTTRPAAVSEPAKTSLVSSTAVPVQSVQTPLLSTRVTSAFTTPNRNTSAPFAITQASSLNKTSSVTTPSQANTQVTSSSNQNAVVKSEGQSAQVLNDAISDARKILIDLQMTMDRLHTQTSSETKQQLPAEINSQMEANAAKENLAPESHDWLPEPPQLPVVVGEPVAAQHKLQEENATQRQQAKSNVLDPVDASKASLDSQKPKVAPEEVTSSRPKDDNGKLEVDTELPPPPAAVVLEAMAPPEQPTDRVGQMFGGENAQKVRNLLSQAQPGTPEYTLKELIEKLEQYEAAISATKNAEQVHNAASSDQSSNTSAMLAAGAVAVAAAVSVGLATLLNFVG